MIKSRWGPVVFLGLDRENVNRLMDNKPIYFHGDAIGLPHLKFVILGGEKTQDILKDLQALGMHIDPKIQTQNEL